MGFDNCRIWIVEFFLSALKGDFDVDLLTVVVFSCSSWGVVLHPANWELGCSGINAERISNHLWIWSHKAAGLNQARKASQSVFDKGLLYWNVDWSCCKHSQVRPDLFLQLQDDGMFLQECRILLRMVLLKNFGRNVGYLQLEGHTRHYSEWEGHEGSDTGVPVMESHPILPWR